MFLNYHIFQLLNRGAAIIRVNRVLLLVCKLVVTSPDYISKPMQVVENEIVLLDAFFNLSDSAVLSCAMNEHLQEPITMTFVRSHAYCDSVLLLIKPFTFFTIIKFIFRKPK